jgi:hypothetical protein
LNTESFFDPSFPHLDPSRTQIAQKGIAFSSPVVNSNCYLLYKQPAPFAWLNASINLSVGQLSLYCSPGRGAYNAVYREAII